MLKMITALIGIPATVFAAAVAVIAWTAWTEDCEYKRMRERN